VSTLSGSIPPGGYFLVREVGSGANGVALPTADLSPVSSFNMSTAGGKVALVAGTTAVSFGTSCPTGASILDFVGYGTANCFEGTVAPAHAVTTSAIRAGGGCADVNANGSDFTVAAVTPRNSATPAQVCSCLVQNESNAALEADYCDVQFPLSLSVPTGASTGNVYGQIFEPGVTPSAGASAAVRAQFGYGPATANPQYEPAWIWTNATFNVQSGNNDEYQAQFTAPAVGSYRYAYRFSLDSGVTWTVCDQNAGDGGAGSNPNLSFELADLPVMTVTP
jgi:hypothetical protein